MPKLVKLLTQKNVLERELKATYVDLMSSSEAKAIKDIKENSLFQVYASFLTNEGFFTLETL